MIFIIFDIEIIFLYPYAVVATGARCYGVLARSSCFSVVFFVVLRLRDRQGRPRLGPGSSASRGCRPAVSAERTTTTTIRRVGLEGRDEPDEAA